MAPFRLQDRWLALGLIAVIYVGGRIISWQIREAERIGIEDKAIRDEEEQNEQLKRKKKGKGEDDIPLDKLAILVRHPDWEIRHAAYAILIQRFASDPYCAEALSKRFYEADKAHDASQMMEITHFKILADNLEVDLRIEDLRQSGGLSRDASTSEGWGLSGSRAQRSRLMLPSNFDSRTSPSSTLFSDLGNLEAARAEHGRANGRPWPPTGRFTEELDDGDGNSDDDSISSSQEEARLERNARFRADAQEAAETSALFGNLPFVPDEEDPWRIWSSNDETGRRRNHREAIVIGHADDGIEVIQQPDSPVPGEVPRMRGGEGDELLDGNEAQAADELIQQVRGLEGQVQGLLDTLHQFEEENGEEN